MTSEVRSHAVALAALFVFAGSAGAWEFRSRFVERVGNVETVIPNGYSIPFDAPTRVRLQMGVFDDGSGPAPAGGFVGWNVGTMSITGLSPGNGAWARRTPGRLAPFNFATGPNSNGNPPAASGDPFASLTEIDCTLGIQTPIWVGCDDNGNPSPQPAPTIRGLNTFVSIYEITLTPEEYYRVFDLNVSGNLFAATSWNAVGTPVPPSCDDPDNPEPGMVTYAPFPTPGRMFSSSITLVSNGVPGPGPIGVLSLAGALATRRRRVVR